jgi:hypothetical protein
MVVEIREQETQRVAHLAVRLAGHVEEFAIDLDVVLEGERAHPPAADVGAEVVEQVGDLERVAQRLRHLAPLLVDDEAMGEEGAKRRRAGDSEGGQQ